VEAPPAKPVVLPEPPQGVFITTPITLTGGKPRPTPESAAAGRALTALAAGAAGAALLALAL
jgi:hypothetical protein